MTARILVVDDEARMAEALATSLRRQGWECEACYSGREALAAFDARGADVVVTDQRMPDLDGLELMQRLRRAAPDLPVILLTAFGEVASAVEAMRLGAFDYVTKPCDNDELRNLVRRALELTTLQRENRRLKDRLEAREGRQLIAASRAMKQLIDLVDRAAASRAAVLLEGESGTGKEVLARRLHQVGDRAEGPFVAINCKAFSDNLLDSELFGHEKGAFTGAERTRQGCFERADGGTLFLDEIGEVDGAFQVKILRVLQEGEVLRVGGNRARPVDVRVVAATNRDLKAEIAAGRFREDLYFRLAVIPLRVPPLRDRPDDILPLAGHFLDHRRQAGEADFRLGEAAQQRLLEHSWPGNVRELENALERACVLARSAQLEPEDFLLEAIPRDVSPSLDLRARLDQATARALDEALAASGGRRAEAAALLGIDRTTLYRLLKRHRGGSARGLGST
ncbi:MAG: sigma-54 dependent transcriptional regulator [Acidobacteriota bacterium]